MKRGNPLGGRPLDPAWDQVILVNRNDKTVTCKTCEMELAKRIDKIKGHLKRCTGFRQDRKKEEGEIVQVDDGNEETETLNQGESHEQLSGTTSPASAATSEVFQAETAESRPSSSLSNVSVLSDYSRTGNLERTFSIFSSTPIKSTTSSTTLPPAIPSGMTQMKKRKIRQSTDHQVLGKYVLTTSQNEVKNIEDKWASFFYQVSS